MNLVLYVGNKNYSSWSLRPWLALTWSGLPFETRAVQLGGEGYGVAQSASVLAVSPSGRVPALHVGETVVWDSLAICEWAAERAPAARLWPEDPLARAVCRSAACEMHSGFQALRGAFPCNIRRRAQAREVDEVVRRDLARVEALWNELRGRYGAGGPYLFGARPTVADAFYLPVATRLRTYGVSFSGAAKEYTQALLADEGFRAWERDAIAETWTMPQWDDH